ncbi:kinetochore protein Nuf2 isoform X2 [Megalops cyprinoides]|uniref:kinetochore protein Nuf2 isoform X2 n=1 Tax=Megalops cyprinoides TaxID=118141 RepID=UPI001864B3FA|nr:kinetochore protein Nuf2 isoform X2 [Megalops cyprinoides]
MAENTFPIYKVDVLVQFYRSEVLTGQEAKHFNKNDITPNPKPDSIQRLYMRILQLLYHIRPECNYVVPFVENIPVLQEWVIPIMSVYLRMCQFLPICHVYDFQLNDLLNPKAKRTISILSGIMNFLHFRKLRLEMTSEYQQSFRADMDKFQAYSKGIKEAEKKIEKLRIIPPEQQAETKELAAAISELTNANLHQLQEVNAINEQIAEWKSEIAERSQKLAQRKMDVATLKEEITKLKSQIVESPEELRNEMEKMKEKVKNIKHSKERADECLVELQIKMQGVNQTEAEIQLMYKLLQDLQGVMDKMNIQQEENQSLVALNEKMQKELKNLSTEEAQLKRALGMKMDKMSKQQIRRQKKREMRDQHVQNLMGQCDQVHQKREEIVEQIQEINRETQQIKAKMQALRDVCSQETEKAQALYDRVLASLDQFHKRIENHVVQGSEDLIKMKAQY